MKAVCYGAAGMRRCLAAEVCSFMEVEQLSRLLTKADEPPICLFAPLVGQSAMMAPPLFELF